MNCGDEDELRRQYLRLKTQHFDCSRIVKSRLNATNGTSRTTSPIPPDHETGLKVPKLDAPTFDGDILSWTRFWEQFSISIDSRKNLSDSEKFVYLQQSLKGGTAKTLIEGLSGTGEHYSKAIACLKGCYDRPRLIHQSHVKAILETPSMKDGNGREFRRLHDLFQQHLCALNAAESDELSQFMTSVIQLKLDPDTLFEWQRHTQDVTEVPPFPKILEFIDLRARASETTTQTSRRPQRTETTPKRSVASFVTNSESNGGRCVVCKTERHPLYLCSRFKDMSHDLKLNTVRTNSLCMNCLKGGHFSKNCKSSHRCRTCQRPHHTLLHVDDTATPSQTVVSSNTATSNPNVLMMTCQVLVKAPDGIKVRVRALLDSASSSSFVSERLVQGLCLNRSPHTVSISGVAGLTGPPQRRSLASLEISSTQSPTSSMVVTAIVVPRVTCELPLHPVEFDPKWTHLSGLSLADEDFGQPGRVDLLLGTDIYVNAMLHGRRSGPPDSPVAFETIFGWVLAGRATSITSSHFSVVAHHVSVGFSDEVLRKFWEIEEAPKSEVVSMEDKWVVGHFKTTHRRKDDGRFLVSLPRRPDIGPLGESRSQAVRRLASLERSLARRGQQSQFNSVIQEYLDLGHAELIPPDELWKPKHETYYLPMHVVYKDSSTSTKIRAVFDASTKSSSGLSLNDKLYVGPTVHTPLLDVLLRFRLHRIALTTDISKMYRAIELVEADRDMHRFVWRPDSCGTLQDYRMTRVTFGVSASSFVANMCVRQNAMDFPSQYPLAAKITETSFYVDDGLTGADNVMTAIAIQRELQCLFRKGGFELHKWNSNDQSVMQHIKSTLQDGRNSQEIGERERSTKTLGIEWVTNVDEFHLTVTEPPTQKELTKRILVSDIASIFDALGWFSPTIVAMKILLQRLWESNLSWDDPAPPDIADDWHRWREELPILKSKGIPRCYFPKDSLVTSKQLHGFSDASKAAYSAVVYLRTVDTEGNIKTSLVSSKTKVSPIKRQTIPRLELCGALLLAKLLNHIMRILEIPMIDLYAWTDSTIVLSWLTGSPRRFKTFVGNRVSQIVDLLPPDRWRHVIGIENPADCTSRGLFPSELINHHLWWSGPDWLRSSSDQWPRKVQLPSDCEPTTELCHLTNTSGSAIVLITSPNQFSSYNRLIRVVAWAIRFTKNCGKTKEERLQLSFLTTPELRQAEIHVFRSVQIEQFRLEFDVLNGNKPLPKGSHLIPLSPFIDSDGLIRVGGRQRLGYLSSSRTHPIILHGNHPIVKMLIRYEHGRLLHGGPTLTISSLNRRFHIIHLRVFARSIIRACVVCPRHSAKPIPPILGQLPPERLTPGTVFNKTGIDYAGPVYVKYGHVRKPVVVKSYICVFVSLNVKAVHLELVSSLTSEGFISCLRRFISRRGYPALMWSDHGTNFIGSNREIKELIDELKTQRTQTVISEFRSLNHIEWKFIPEHSPHFGGLWEAAVKSFKIHLKRVIGEVKLTFEEMYTVLTQIEACLNSRPLVPINNPDDEGLEVLTPGHFLIGRPLMALPDTFQSYPSMSLIRRWHLCQTLVNHFWKRWSLEYLATLRKASKWHGDTRNVAVGDVVILVEDRTIPTQWPIARIHQTYPGADGVVRVVDLKTSKGIYRRPVHKIAKLVTSDI